MWFAFWETMINAAIFASVILSALGLYIASYFTLVYYGLLEANTRLVPRVCQLEERSCKTVLSTRYARIFGVPNSLLGVLYYLFVVIVLMGGFTDASISLALVAVAWFTVAAGIGLTYALFFMIRIPCPLCLTGHTINLALAILVTILLG